MITKNLTVSICKVGAIHVTESSFLESFVKLAVVSCFLLMLGTSRFCLSMFQCVHDLVDTNLILIGLYNSSHWGVSSHFPSMTFYSLLHRRSIISSFFLICSSNLIFLDSYLWCRYGNKKDMGIKKNHASDFLMSKDFVKELEQPDSQSRIAVVWIFLPVLSETCSWFCESVLHLCLNSRKQGLVITTGFFTGLFEDEMVWFINCNYLKIGELCLSSSIGHIWIDKLLIDARGTYKMHLACLNWFFFLGFLERGDLENDFVSLDMENNGFQEGKKFSVCKWLPCSPFKR